MEDNSLTAPNQPFSRKRPIKKRFDPSTLPHIDPYLISIAALASRFIVEIEDAFATVMNASSNDGREVTVIEWFPGARQSPEHFNGERVEIDAAYNIIRGDAFEMLLERADEWYFKRARVHLDLLKIIHGKLKVDLPIEIQQAVQAFALNHKRRETLTDMLVLTMRRAMR
jgi:hypothetical protein